MFNRAQGVLTGSAGVLGTKHQKPSDELPAPGGLAAVLLLSLALNAWNVTFPLGYHHDEPKKVRFIQTGTQDFRQPLLMLQLTRLANGLLGRGDPQAIVVLGRVITAAAGVAVVWLTYELGKTIMSATWSLLAAAMTAVCPLLVVHAHYLKEDVLLTAWLLLGLLLIVRYTRLPDARCVMALGVVCGLAVATHYKGLLLLALIPISRWLLCVGHAVRDNRRGDGMHGTPYGDFAAIVALTGLVFAVVNFPLLSEPEVFLEGASFQAEHVVRGHTLRIWPTDFAGCFYLWHSLPPGIGWGATIGWLLALVWIVFSWRRHAFAARLLVAYSLLFYGVVEFSPLKPAPDFDRYVLPLAPAAMLLTVYLLQQLWNARPRVAVRAALLAVAVSCWSLLLVDSLRLVYHLNRDTRAMAAAWLKEHDARAVHETHSGTRYDMQYAADADLDQLRSRGVTHVVTSSFAYDRYFRGQRLRSRQSPQVHARAARYAAMFQQYPYTEFRPRHRSYAFSNPVIRILDIRERHTDGQAHQATSRLVFRDSGSSGATGLASAEVMIRNSDGTGRASGTQP